MTSLNVELKQRKISIEIAEILSTRKEGPAGFPKMVVKDTDGKQHTLSSVDFFISLREWKKIGTGSKIVIYIEEVVKRTTMDNQRIMHDPVTIEEDIKRTNV